MGLVVIWLLLVITIIAFWRIIAGQRDLAATLARIEYLLRLRHTRATKDDDA